ncbi:MAG: Tab2/Atab2 family RNA-binding protein [Calothrix sp. MO_167.B12]|nr:Tab2/Atab2 family RNA-binding protein [Calothrix sp. MO_167.B12]
MSIWQADFYRRSQPDKEGEVVWDLFICDRDRNFAYQATCPQSQANSTWVASQLKLAAGKAGNKLPDVIQVFRPQSVSLITQSAMSLGINTEATRRTPALKQWLIEQQISIAIEKPPPVPLPENLWGEEWRFASIPAGDLVDVFAERPIPILAMPEFLLPINLGIASTQPIPGVVIYGGRRSLHLARWLQEANPVAINYIAGEPDGLVLEAGLADRWIIATFEDKEVKSAAGTYQQRQQNSKGLHFLLVQPDDSGMTYSGLWLLKPED